MQTQDWFTVSRDGLRQLQEGKPKSFIARELVQNAFDEVTPGGHVTVATVWDSRKRLLTLVVEDDAEEGFRDLTHAFTLFAPTYKRGDPKKRGRYNLGEKQALAPCRTAHIITTKGEILFDQKGRHHKRGRTEAGSTITVTLTATKEEYLDMIEALQSYKPPHGIEYRVRGELIPYVEPHRVVPVTSLRTEVQDEDGVMRGTRRATDLFLYQELDPFLYEMGLPVCPVACEYSIDVQQKVPMGGPDRDTVPQSYLRTLFAEVLNATIKEIPEEKSSEPWVRAGMGHKRAAPETVQQVITKRFGEKVCVANPTDPNANDDALADGYHVIRGRELSAEEWGSIKRSGKESGNSRILASSTQIFGSSRIQAAEPLTPTPEMEAVAKLAQFFADEVLGVRISVSFIHNPQADRLADYGQRQLRFNVGRLGKKFFKDPLARRVVDLIFHELGHERGRHTERSYHDALTLLGARAFRRALFNPELFDEWRRK